MSRSYRRCARAGALVLLLGPGGTALADGLFLRFEPSYASSETTTTDQTGRTTHSSSSALTESYQLSLDKTLFPNLRLGGSGRYDVGLGSTSSSDSPTSQFDRRRWSIDGRLVAGTEVLRGTVGYTRGEQSSANMTAGVTSRAPTLVNETLSFNGLWRPDRLPPLDLVISRTRQYDQQRKTADLTVDDLLLSTTYQPDQHVNVRYRFQYDHALESIQGTDTSAFIHKAQASYSDRFLDNRLSVYGSYDSSIQTTQTRLFGSGGTVATQQLPIAGLSVVEAFPAVSTKVALNPNPALIDGDTIVSAGLNIGFGPSLSGDNANRDMGAQFPTGLANVNLIYVWVDRPLPLAVSGAFGWTAYVSDNNLDWTPVALDGPVQFGLFQNRFEIPIRVTTPTPPRYIKIVTKPLPPAVTTDRSFTDIIVTEVQFFERVAATSASHTTINGFLSGSARLELMRSPRLYYDLSVGLTHSNSPSQVTWSVTNGLSLSQRLSRVIEAAARVDRAESQDSQGHASQTHWNASLNATPMPGLGAAMSYSGDLNQSSGSRALTNTVGLLGQATPYRGISLLANLGYSIGTRPADRLQRTASASFTAALEPHRTLTVSGSFLYSDSITTGGGQPDANEYAGRLEGSVSFSPFTTLYMSGSVSRLVIGVTPYTTASFAANFSPFPGGDLILSFNYNESIDTASQARARNFGPYLRWNIVRGTYVETSYSVLATSSPVQDTSSRTFNARLVLLL